MTRDAALRRVWRGVPSIAATCYEDSDGNQIVGSRGEWMLLAGESVIGPFKRLMDAKRYVEENDV